MLSYQFRNLVRGPSFAKLQMAKWLQGTEPLSTEEIQLIESVAHETMTKLGYKLHLISDENPPMVFTDADLAEFQRLNKEGIKEMNSKLLEEDPDDFHRRVYQAEILSLPPTLIDPNLKSEAALHLELNEISVQSSVTTTRASDTIHTKEQKLYPHVSSLNREHHCTARQPASDKSAAGARDMWTVGRSEKSCPDARENDGLGCLDCAA